MRWARKARKILRIADNMSDILIHLRDKPKPLDYLSIGLRALNTTITHVDSFKKSSFKDWDLEEMWEYRSWIYETAKVQYGYETVREADDGEGDIITVIHGQRIGWTKGRNDYLYGPYFEKGNREPCLEAIGRMIWETIGSNNCEIVKKKKANSYAETETIFRSDILRDDVHKSKKADFILERVRKFLQKGYGRSIMLYGRPGTGKSTAMRYIAKELGKYSLRINVTDLDHLSQEDMLLAIQLLKPNTLIIDDFDRVFKPDKLLTSLEQLNKNSGVQLIIVSVNNIEKLDTAVLRPGRFDDKIELEKIDEEIVDRLIGPGVPPKVKKRLAALPVAYIEDFHKRREVLGLETAINEIEDLELRIRKITEEDDEELEEDE